MGAFEMTHSLSHGGNPQIEDLGALRLSTGLLCGYPSRPEGRMSHRLVTVVTWTGSDASGHVPLGVARATGVWPTKDMSPGSGWAQSFSGHVDFLRRV